MSSEAQINQVATTAAEGVLELIYGADLQGCTVSLDAVAGVDRQALQPTADEDRSLLVMLEKGTEAIGLSAPPPHPDSELTPEALQGILGERLDTILSLTKKISETIGALRARGSQMEQ